jgi:streptomycin 6-kinase
MQALRKYLNRWDLTSDGEPVDTASSTLWPVRCADQTPAMLKLAYSEEEQRGNALMTWWNGAGAARVIAHDGEALLMERATGTRSLAEMSRNGRDTEATQIICRCAARLHSTRETPPPPTVPLSAWFAELEPAAIEHGGVLCKSLRVSRMLLSNPVNIVVLHGDLHHANVLDGGTLGWLAIDPKALRGERGFDFANIFCNPNSTSAKSPGRLAKQASVVAHTARVEHTRLLQWILACAGLSAAWSLHSDHVDLDKNDPRLALAIAEIAASQLPLNT